MWIWYWINKGFEHFKYNEMSDTMYKVSDLLFKVGYMNIFSVGVVVGFALFVNACIFYLSI